jgi:hypothetical protein
MIISSKIHNCQVGMLYSNEDMQNPNYKYQHGQVSQKYQHGQVSQK